MIIQEPVMLITKKKYLVLKLINTLFSKLFEHHKVNNLLYKSFSYSNVYIINIARIIKVDSFQDNATIWKSHRWPALHAVTVWVGTKQFFRATVWVTCNNTSGVKHDSLPPPAKYECADPVCNSRMLQDITLLNGA